MSDKPLCYLVKIDRLDKIPGKDRILLAHMKYIDWTVIVGKDDFQHNTDGIFFEVNSILPPIEMFEFLRKRCWNERLKGHVIKTMKLKNEDNTYSLSQGLLLPLTQIDANYVNKISQDGYEYGKDLSKIFGVRSIEDDVPEYQVPQKSNLIKFLDKWTWKLFRKRLIKKPSGGFPSHLISKTDETQVQSLTYVYDDWQGKKIYITEKMDGTSCSMIYWNKRFIVTSRSVKLYDEPIKKAQRELSALRAEKYRSNPYLFVAARYTIPKDIIKACNTFNCKGFAIQGEVCGPNIQKNRIGLKDYKFYVFNIKKLTTNFNENKYFSWTILEQICNKMGVPTVPFIKQTVFTYKNIDELREEAKGEYPSGHPREGIVIRLIEDMNEFVPDPQYKMSNMASFKVINEDFRLRVEA